MVSAPPELKTCWHGRDGGIAVSTTAPEASRPEVSELTGCGRLLVVVHGHLTGSMAATPALRSLRKALPEARIDVLGLRCVRPILGRSPHINSLIEWGDFRHRQTPVGRIEKGAMVAALGLRLRRRNYDATLILHASSRPMRTLAQLVGSPLRAGIADGSDGYSHPAPPPVGGVESARQENARILAAVGLADDGGPVELVTTAGEQRRAGQFLGAGTGPLIGIHAGADWSCQEWLPERFAEVAATLQRQTGARLVLTGSATQAALQDQIASGLPLPPIRTAGRTSFGEFVEVIRRLDLLICVSTAASAVADAVGTPSVVLLGPEDRRLTGMESSTTRRILQPGGTLPTGSWCELGRYPILWACESPVCRGVGGLDRLRPSEVTAAALELLAVSGLVQKPTSRRLASAC